jgi:hypothetical protein
VVVDEARIRGISTRTTIALAVIAGLIVWALLTYWGGCDDSQPTAACYSMFRWYEVPREGWVAVAAGGATAVVVFIALWLWGRRR